MKIDLLADRVNLTAYGQRLLAEKLAAGCDYSLLDSVEGERVRFYRVDMELKTITPMYTEEFYRSCCMVMTSACADATECVIRMVAAGSGHRENHVIDFCMSGIRYNKTECLVHTIMDMLRIRCDAGIYTLPDGSKVKFIVKDSQNG